MIKMEKSKIDLLKECKSKIWRCEDLKIWDSTRIYDSDRILGATDKGMNTTAHDIGTPEAYSGSGPWKIGLVRVML
jgi:hypothetical protein